MKISLFLFLIELLRIREGARFESKLRLSSFIYKSYLILHYDILYSTIILSSESLSYISSLKFNCNVYLLFILEGDDRLLYLFIFLFFEELLFNIICLSIKLHFY